MYSTIERTRPQVVTRSAFNLKIKPVEWKDVSDGRLLGFCCAVRLKPDETGGYLAYSPELDGAVSQGDNLESALRNICEAVSACLETYISEKMPIPWIDPKPLEDGESEFRIAVNV